MENPASPASVGKPASHPPEQDFFTRIVDIENADNLHAQRDPEGKYRYMGERIQRDINRTAAVIKRFMQHATRTAANLNRAQEETGNENHFGNWAVPVVENTLGKADPTVLNLGYQPVIMAILSHPANLAIAENLIETIETDVNGREKRELVKDAFNHEFLHEFSKLGLAFSALFSQIVADTFDSTESRERSDNINRMLVAAMQENDAYLARSMPFEKCIVEGDEAQTVENLTQWYYELIGSKGPYAAAAVATGGESLMAGAGLTGSTAILWHAAKDFSINLALSNAEIVRLTGKSDWRLAVKTAMLATAAGKTVEWQMEKLGGKGNAAFIGLLSDAFKTRIQEMIRKEMIEKSKEPGRKNNPDNRPDPSF